jgi:hypothetical protein
MPKTPAAPALPAVGSTAWHMGKSVIVLEVHPSAICVGHPDALAEGEAPSDPPRFSRRFYMSHEEFAEHQAKGKA